MSDQRTEKPRRHAILSLVLVAVSLLGLTAVTTGALFTDTAVAGGNQFVTGTVKIGTTPTLLPVTVSAMAPGDELVGPVQVDNTGTLEERYSMTAKTDDAASDLLAGQLVYTVKTGVSTCTSAGFDATGSVLYTGPLASTAGINILGDPAQGQQNGDRVLAAGAHDGLCMRIALPKSTGNAYQNQTANVTVTINAEQTANN